MATVLAIDAAWTADEPSGVALVSTTATGWRCVAVSPSYGAFIGLGAGFGVNWGGHFTGQAPDVTGLLAAATRLVGATVDLVTVDMPIATVPIAGRRAADNEVSIRFGGLGCSTHTPNAVRPGPLGATLSTNLAARGFPIANANDLAGTPNRLVEVYPHPALLSLLHRDYRVPYKVSKARRYWPNATTERRIEFLLGEFTAIHQALSAFFGPLGVPLPQAAEIQTCRQLKKYEDALDALVCAWVGVRYLEGATIGLGDNTAAIWCPTGVVGPLV